MMLYKYFTIDNYRFDYEWSDIEEINSTVPLAFIAAEDQLFLKHSGFDIKAIENAITYNKNHESKRGASTISQQVAKNIFLVPTKSFFRKGAEAYFTLLIELIWSKKRIMEVYLNTVELGEGTFGVVAASERFFSIKSNAFSRNQAALLATALPNPILFNIEKPSNYMLQRKVWVLQQMNNLGGEQILISWYE